MAAMASHTRATPGVYTSDRASRLRMGTLASIRSLPPRCMRNTRSDTLPMRTPASPRSAATTASACSPPLVAQVTSTWMRSIPEAVTSSAVTRPPAASMAWVSSLTPVARAGMSSRTVIDEETLGAEGIAPS